MSNTSVDIGDVLVALERERQKRAFTSASDTSDLVAADVAPVKS